MSATNFATKLGLSMPIAKGKLPYEPARLVDRKGDITKRWHIEFYAWNSLTQKL